MSGRHTRIVGQERHVWKVESLWEKARHLEVIEVEIEGVPELDTDCWFDGTAPTLRQMAHHAKRIDRADLSHPVILNQNGELMDGGHRICKALMRGDTLIRAVRFESTPEPDERIPLVE